MKKTLAIICAVAVLVSALAGTFLFASADAGVTEVILPTYVDAEGNPIALVGGEEAIPTSVVNNATVKSIDNRASIPFPNLFEFGKATEDAASNFEIRISPASGKGALLYIETPNASGGKYHFTPYIIYGDNKGAYEFGLYTSTKFYTLAEGDDSWNGIDILSYGIDLDGFKGYVYIPFSSYTQAPVPEDAEIKAIQLQLKKNNALIPENKSVVISAPAIVKGTKDTDANNPELPSAEKVTIGEAEHYYFGNEPAPVLEGSKIALPEYKDPQGNPTTLVGGEANIPTSIIDANFSATMKSVANKANIPFPNLFTITKETQAVGGNFNLRFAPQTGKGALFYVDAPVSEGSNLIFAVYVHSDDGWSYRYANGRNFYTLADGDASWKAVGMQTYGININGFKGYVYVPFASLDQANKVSTGSKVDIVQLHIKNGDTKIPAGDPLYVSAPAIVKGDVDASYTNISLPDAAKVNDGTEVYTYFAVKKTEHTANELMIVNPAKLPAAVTVGGAYAAPTGVTATGVESVGGLGLLPDLKISSTTDAEQFIALFNEMDKKTAAKAVGFMNYYKLGNEAREFKHTMKARDINGNDLNGYIYNGKAYALADGETEWVELPVTKYKYTLPANFSGFVKFIFADAGYAFAGAGGSADAIYNLVNVNIGTYSAISEENAVTIGQPVHIYQDANTNICMIGQALDMSDGGADAGHVVGGGTGTTPPPEGGEGGEGGEGSGGETPDPNPGGGEGGEGGETPAVQPEYKLPAYTGEAIDYSELSIQKATVAIMKGVAKVGSAPEGITLPIDEKKGITGGTIEAVAARNGITNYPTFKINKKSGSRGDWVPYVSFALNTDVSPKGALEILYYVELPAGKAADASINWNFINKDNLAYYNMMYNGTVSIMASDAKEWTDLSVSAYVFSLPAGFKGYIKVNTKNINAQANSPAGDKATFDSDTEKLLKNTSIYLLDLEETDSVYVAAPLIVTKGGSIPFAAFVDGEENAARNIFTGAVLTRDDLKEYLGVEGSENLKPETAPEIDYKIPAYTGAQETYGNYLFARIRQMVLTDNIAKGYVIPLTTFEDGHADKNNGYTKLVDSLVGISKMPFFAITKTTGNPSESNVTVGTWHPKKAEQQNAKAGALLQYIKLPEDLEKPFVGIYMNCHDENFIAQNIAPYSGTVYFMPKGTNEWQTAKITAYWYELPKGFEGFIMYDTKTLKAQNTSNEWSSTWTPYNWMLRVANLKEQTVIASAPFWADSVGDIDYACWLNDETKAVRDIFTGKILKKEDVIKPLNIGDTLVKLPDYTTEFSVGFVDESALSNGTLMLKWDEIDNAAKYTVRVFKKTSTDDGIAYTLFKAEDTTETTITMEGLDLNTQYAVVVYAYNAKNDEIAVFDYLNASTAAGGAPAAPVKPTTPGAANKKPAATEEEETGLSQTTIILIVVGAVVLVLAIAAVVTILLIKKRKAKANN